MSSVNPNQTVNDLLIYLNQQSDRILQMPNGYEKQTEYAQLVTYVGNGLAKIRNMGEMYYDSFINRVPSNTVRQDLMRVVGPCSAAGPCSIAGPFSAAGGPPSAVEPRTPSPVRTQESIAADWAKIINNQYNTVSRMQENQRIPARMQLNQDAMRMLIELTRGNQLYGRLCISHITDNELRKHLRRKFHIFRAEAKGYLGVGKTLEGQKKRMVCLTFPI